MCAFNNFRRKGRGGGLVAGLQSRGAWMATREAHVQFIRVRQVLEMLGVSRTTLWRMVRAGIFPPPIRITHHARGYLRATVEDWMSDRVEGTLVPPLSAVAQRTAAGQRTSGATVGFDEPEAGGRFGYFE